MEERNIKNDDIQTVNRAMAQLDDIEFITYADYLSSPYYRAYIDAKCRAKGEAETWAEQANTYRYDNNLNNARVDNTPIYSEKNKTTKEIRVKDAKASKNAKLYVKKRSFALVIVAILFLVVVAATALGAVGLNAVDSYVAIYVEPAAVAADNVNVPVLDPIFGIIKDLAKVDLDSNFYENYLANKPADADIMTKIALYAVPIAALLTVIFAIIGVIKAFGALASKKSFEGYYKKYKFGFISIVMFICSLILVVGGLYVANIDIANALDYILQKKTMPLFAGYTLYGLVVIPIITFICSCVSYKKLK